MKHSFLTLVILSLAVPGFAGEEKPQGGEDGEALQKKIETLIASLGSKEWKEREKATQALIQIGEPAIPALEKAEKSKDAEVQYRAGLALRKIREGIEAQKRLGARDAFRHTESAVLIGLIWLKNHQNQDGMWSCTKFMGNCQKGKCGGAGSAETYDMGVTGLSLLAFLGAGHTHKHGKFKQTVKNALKAMKARQTPDGCTGAKSADGRWIFNHAITTMAWAEAYGLSNKSPLLQGPAQKALDFLIDCQNPKQGWRYGKRPGESDTSVTAWAVLAMKSAKISGLHVPQEAFDGAWKWFDKVTDKNHRAGYTAQGNRTDSRPEAKKPFKANETPTAASVVGRIFIQGGKAVNHPQVLGGGNLLLRNVPKWDVKGGTIDMHYWYFGTLAMFQLGRQFWKGWHDPLKNALIPTQKRSGCENGSWDPVGCWGKAGGRVYSTAMNVLSLEIYYRYGRILKGK
ncbi:MAG: hypothetical protein ACYTHM_17495 [Planctomycetota bacterium]|jgi:hypothetical protein